MSEHQPTQVLPAPQPCHGSQTSPSLIVSTLDFVPTNLDLNILFQSQHFYLDILCQRHLNLVYSNLSWRSPCQTYSGLIFPILPKGTNIHPNSHGRSDESPSCPPFLLCSISSIHWGQINLQKNLLSLLLFISTANKWPLPLLDNAIASHFAYLPLLIAPSVMLICSGMIVLIYCFNEIVTTLLAISKGFPLLSR